MSDHSPARRALAALDLTDLAEDTSEAKTDALCARASTPFGSVAAVCVWPRFVARAKEFLGDSRVKVATVANFPAGGEDAVAVREEIARALADGADEIDVVIPWRAILDDRPEIAIEVLRAAREAAGSATLKVILETGELGSAGAIALAAGIAIEEGGADFLKTSTGKTPVSATPAAVAILLDVIAGSGRDVGLKISGGVRTVEDAALYLDMVDSMMDETIEDGEGHWAVPGRFRIGASSLLEALLIQIGSEPGGGVK